jgi:acyl-coenzyme A thioesterase PaaI-like protein
VDVALSLQPPADASPPQPRPDAPPPGTLLPPHYVRCFGCGPEQPHGLHLQVQVGEGATITATFTVTPAHGGAPGLAHGGVLATAMDEALGFVAGLQRRPAVTGKLEVEFVRPVPIGTELHITARGLGDAGRKVYVSGEARMNAPDGEIAVRAGGLFIVVPVEHFLTHGDADEFRSTMRADAEIGSYNP